MTATERPARKGSTKAIVAVVALLLGMGGGFLIYTVTSDDGGSTEGEIFLTPADDVGDEPFAPDPFAAAPDPSLAQTATPVNAPITVSATPAVSSNTGGTPGLYGGTKDIAACDAQKMVDYLAANPDKAKGWVDALNADPDVKMADGSPLTVEKIPDYVATLTPLVLLEDTRVTNHGFKDGKANPLQSVLQKGTAVLVDDHGVPRAKCFCGNPLLPPKAATTKPKYVGKTWPDFDPGKISVVVRNNTVINNFVVTDIKTGTTFPLSAGTKITGVGTATPGSTTTAPATTAPATTAAPTTTAPATTTTGAPATSTAPVLGNGTSERTPAGDSFCVGTYGPASQAYDIKADYSDPDGDAQGGKVFLFGDVATDFSFSGDGSSGVVRVGVCYDPGSDVEISISDGAGNTSNVARVTV